MRRILYLIEGIRLRISLFFSSFKNRSKKDLINSLNLIKNALAQEGKETKEMLEIYYKYSSGEATKEEMDKANEQFQDLVKTLGIGFVAVLPLAPLTIPFLVKIGKRYGIDILPTSFKKD